MIPPARGAIAFAFLRRRAAVSSSRKLAKFVAAADGIAVASQNVSLAAWSWKAAGTPLL